MNVRKDTIVLQCFSFSHATLSFLVAHLLQGYAFKKTKRNLTVYVKVTLATIGLNDNQPPSVCCT